MTTEIRDLGFLAWRDPDAWMEAMRGPQWDALVAEENERLATLLLGKEELVATFKKELEKAATYFELECFRSGPILITPLSAFRLRWRYEHENEYTYASDVLYHGEQNIVAYTHDIGKGAELYELVVQQLKTRKILWRKSPVGPIVSFSGHADIIFYLGVEQKLWYNKLFTCNSRTGENITELYREKDAHYNLSISRKISYYGSFATFLVRENSGKTDTFYINEHNNTLTQLKPGSERQIPFTDSQSDEGYEYFYRDPDSDIYKDSNGTIIDGTPFDARDNATILVRKQGATSVINKLGRRELHIKQGSIQLDKYGVSSNCVRIDDGTQPPYCSRRIKTSSQHSGAFKLKPRYISAISSDGSQVHGVLLHKVIITKPKALLAVGYGAYGEPCSPAGAYAKWAPLLERGWGVLYTYIRGGGDDTDAWAQAGRLEGRSKTRDDFLALVGAAQQQFKISAAATVIYGRSAGGFLMGMCLNKEPTGRLFGTVYTEVPYVDILRTTTNPTLPLTAMEYNEFGDPAHRPQEFGFLVDLSPADVAVTTDAPNVFVLARTGLNDSEVYAYEPVKWIRRLRKPGNKAPKVIGIAKGEGHFYSSAVAFQAKAEDLALLHSRCVGV